MLKGEYEELQNRSEGVSDALVSETPAQEFSQLSETPAQEFSQLDATLLRLGGRERDPLMPLRGAPPQHPGWGGGSYDLNVLGLIPTSEAAQHCGRELSLASTLI